jgi:hypothetical protein
MIGLELYKYINIASKVIGVLERKGTRILNMALTRPDRKGTTVCIVGLLETVRPSLQYEHNQIRRQTLLMM